MKLSDLETRYDSHVQLTNPRAVVNELRDIKAWPKEVFVVFNLDTAGKVISREIVSVGILNACVVHPREVFINAINSAANSIILAHNHPSSCVEPSNEDRHVTSQIKQAGDIIGIKLLDHVIVGKGNEAYYSFNENHEL